MPKQVLQDVSKICRAFLWSGEHFSMKAGYVKWDGVCTPKSVGGLGIRNVYLWNIAAMGKYVWAMEKKLITCG